MSSDARVFPDEQLPEGSVVDGETVTRPIDETFDFVVVGSGAAGVDAAVTSLDLPPQPASSVAVTASAPAAIIVVLEAFIVRPSRSSSRHRDGPRI